LRIYKIAVQHYRRKRYSVASRAGMAGVCPILCPPLVELSRKWW
jgi:hypothetical protein